MFLRGQWSAFVELALLRTHDMFISTVAFGRVLPSSASTIAKAAKVSISVAMNPT